MDDKINNGGPAFPVRHENGFTNEGMTLRDWFAGQALSGLISAGVPTKHIGNEAYEIADAMLAARSR